MLSLDCLQLFVGQYDYWSTCGGGTIAGDRVIGCIKVGRDRNQPDPEPTRRRLAPPTSCRMTTLVMSILMAAGTLERRLCDRPLEAVAV
jgi:hypothetical protein